MSVVFLARWSLAGHALHPGVLPLYINTPTHTYTHTHTNTHARAHLHRPTHIHPRADVTHDIPVYTVFIYCKSAWVVSHNVHTWGQGHGESEGQRSSWQVLSAQFAKAGCLQAKIINLVVRRERCFLFYRPESCIHLSQVFSDEGGISWSNNVRVFYCRKCFVCYPPSLLCWYCFLMNIMHLALSRLLLSYILLHWLPLPSLALFLVTSIPPSITQLIALYTIHCPIHCPNTIIHYPIYYILTEPQALFL